MLRLATPDELFAIFPDCEPGVVPPFGRLYGLTTLVDSGLAEITDIVLGANTRHEGLRMHFTDFQALEQPIRASFTRPIAPEHHVLVCQTIAMETAAPGRRRVDPGVDVSLCRTENLLLAQLLAERSDSFRQRLQQSNSIVAVSKCPRPARRRFQELASVVGTALVDHDSGEVVERCPASFAAAEIAMRSFSSAWSRRPSR